MAEWYYAPNGQQAGPVPFTDLQLLATEGRLQGGDLVWTEGMPQWQPAMVISGLMPAAAPIPAAPVYATPYGQPHPNDAAPATYQNAYVAPSPHANMALTGMVLSLCSIMVGGPLLAVPGLICGWLALKGMKRDNNFQNRGFALTAVWVGAIWTALFVLIILIIVVAVVAGR